MISNYFLSAIRFFVRNKTFSIINLLSLAAGLACVIVISSWVLSELNYDKFHNNASRIYRLSSKLTMSGEESYHATHHAPIGHMVAEKFPEVQQMTRFSRAQSRVFRHNNETVIVEGIHYVDSAFFHVFSFKLLEGGVGNALNRPNTLVLTKSVAQAFFGNESAMGQAIESDGTMYNITGVVEDPPENSSLQFKVLEPMATANHTFGGFSWGYGMGFQTFLLLKEGTNTSTLEDKIAVMMDENVNELFKSINVTIGAFLEALPDLYLKSKVQRQRVQGDIRTIIIFSVSALLVLIIACFNFINLSTAQSLLRAREVGVRKVFGANRSQLMVQHLGESVLMVSLALVLALVLAELVLPLVELFSGKNLDLYSVNTAFFLIGIPIIVLVAGLGAGWYPALFISRYSPISILNGSMKSLGGKHSFRNILSFLQFAILQSLAICTIIVYAQLQHIKTTDMGFSTENLIALRVNSPMLKDKKDALKSSMVNSTAVKQASLHSFLLGHTILARDFVLEGSPEAQNISYITIDENFFDAYGVEVVEGRAFKRPLENEARKIVVNEAFVKHFNYYNPIGRKIFLPNNKDHRENEIVGVVKNFSHQSLHSKVAPIVMMTWHDPYEYISIKLTDGSPLSFAKVKSEWESIAGETPFDYFYVEDKMGELYSKDIRFGNILGVFTLLAILIACAGLFGLTAHVTQTRRREIAIRKVLGASSSGITALLSISFVKWVVIASIAAWPLAWIIMSRWLDNFAHRIEMPIWAFVVATVVSLFVAFATTLVKTLIASNQNPAFVLKQE
ncbi:MAG: ABC transporter permease [Bacteroidales bacterium]